MVQTAPDTLFDCIHDLKQTVDADPHDRDSHWLADLHAALGHVASGIDDELQSVEQTPETLGDINPDLQGAPGAERHAARSRDQLLRLGEKVQRLRADISKARVFLPLDLVQWGIRGEEIVVTFEEVQRANDSFLLDALNSNPGAGD